MQIKKRERVIPEYYDTLSSELGLLVFIYYFGGKRSISDGTEEAV